MEVLLIEDDPNMVGIISLAFQLRLPEARLIPTNYGERGIELVRNKVPNIVILDLGLPDVDGFDVLERIRMFSSVPILILTARGEEADILRGVELGADDYTVKPFRQMELLARAKMLALRASPRETAAPMMCGPLYFHPPTRQLLYYGRQVAITATEADILFQLMKAPGQVVVYSTLAETVWGEDYPGADESLKIHVERLRTRLDEDPGAPQLILSQPGVGYVLAVPEGFSGANPGAAGKSGDADSASQGPDASTPNMYSREVDVFSLYMYQLECSFDTN